MNEARMLVHWFIDALNYIQYRDCSTQFVKRNMGSYHLWLFESRLLLIYPSIITVAVVPLLQNLPRRGIANGLLNYDELISTIIATQPQRTAVHRHGPPIYPAGVDEIHHVVVVVAVLLPSHARAHGCGVAIDFKHVQQRWQHLKLEHPLRAARAAGYVRQPGRVHPLLWLLNFGFLHLPLLLLSGCSLSS